tara:strand:+ start:132 stop:806 length:675 start_codon:yes stop_codon:yes gene_type:complete
MKQQLTFDLNRQPAYNREDFLVSDGNAQAFALVEGYESWRSHAALITGPSGSGKTHLMHVWQGLADARALSQAELMAEAWTVPVTQLPLNIAIDNIDTLVGESVAEKNLFHLLNVVKTSQSRLLLTANKPPAQWNFAVKDLESRILALPAAVIQPPDEGLLFGLFAKLLHDRQLNVQPDVVSFTIMRLGRSCAEVIEAVEKLDAASLSEKRDITLPFVKKTLGI